MRTFQNLAFFRACIGQEIGVSPWETITQDQINVFADATGDHQWIHIDRRKAAAHSPYKTTIAHGYLTLSLAPRLMEELYQIRSVKMAVNYGADKVRFTGPVPSGSRIRMRFFMQDLKEHSTGGQLLTARCTFEREGTDKPVCVAELLMLLYESELGS